MRFVLAYIDASSGSIVLQAIVGGGLAALYAGRRFGAQAVQATRSLFSRGRRLEETPSKSENSSE